MVGDEANAKVKGSQEWLSSEVPDEVNFFLFYTMNCITDIMETTFRPSTLPATPVHLQEAMTCAQTLKKNWLMSIQLVMLIDIFEHEPHAAIANQPMKDDEDLCKSWIHMKLCILVPVVDKNKSF